MPTALDARGRRVRLDRRPQRVVSLVPSLTESVATLADARLLVGVTKFCREPAALVAPIRKVGGTKDPDVATIVSLAPDLVLANQEENRREDIEALEAAGLTVFVGYPRGVREALAELETLAELLQVGVRLQVKLEPIRAELERQESLNAERPRLRVFCPIWRNPYLAVGGDTYAGDVLRLVGGENVFESHPSGARYPQVDLAAIRAADPELIFLPDEPYFFRERHRAELLALREIRAAREGHVVLVNGRWLTWYGPRIAEGLLRLEKCLDQARPSWQPPPRPEESPQRPKGPTPSASKAGGTARRDARKNAPKPTRRPKRSPRTDPAMPPGLRLHVQSQEEVVED